MIYGIMHNTEWGFTVSVPGVSVQSFRFRKVLARYWAIHAVPSRAVYING